MSDTPETDARQQQSKIQNQGIQDSRWPWQAIDAGYDFARNLERQRNMLLEALEGVMEWEPRLKDEPEFKAYEEAREAIASVKQVSPYVGKES